MGRFCVMCGRVVDMRPNQIYCSKKCGKRAHGNRERVKTRAANFNNRVANGTAAGTFRLEIMVEQGVFKREEEYLERYETNPLLYLR